MENTNWIRCIVEETYQNYNGREIVLWGKYDVSEGINARLETSYGIKAAFYVDKDTAKIDNKQVRPTSCLQGRSDEYYVVVPLPYFQSLKEELDQGGYIKGKDYCYFCDCVVQDTSDYYEDTHGNKIIGPHHNCKWVFSGFNSVVKIGENPDLSGSEFYIYNDVEIEVGDNCRILKTRYCIKDAGKLKIGSRFTNQGFSQSLYVIGTGTAVIIGEDCMFSQHIFSGRMTDIVFSMSVQGRT